MSIVRPVLDASAILAMFRGEPGADRTEELLDGAALSTVNLSEVIQKAEQHAVDTDGLEFDLESLGIVVVPFTADHAHLAAELWARHPRLGLALGDRACLALATSMDGVAVTTDRAWKKVSGVAVEVVR